MLTLADVLRDFIADNPFLQFGMRKRLFNLSHLSKELRPQIEVRAKKEVKDSTILMALSRLQRTMKAHTPHQDQVDIENITIQTGLSIYTYTKTKEVHQGVNKLFVALQKENSYLTICEGLQEITMLLDTSRAPLVKQFIPQKPKHHQDNLAALGLTFDEERYLSTPGVICLVLEQLLLQSINMIEVSSTYSGLTLYVADKDAKLAFDTLFRCFLGRAKSGFAES